MIKFVFPSQPRNTPIVKSESASPQSCLTLCDPMDCSLPGSSVHAIFQARILEWSAISFSRRSSWPRDRTKVSCIAGRFLTIWATLCCILNLCILFIFQFFNIMIMMPWKALSIYLYLWFSCFSIRVIYLNFTITGNYVQEGFSISRFAFLLPS